MRTVLRAANVFENNLMLYFGCNSCFLQLPAVLDLCIENQILYISSFGAKFGRERIYIKIVKMAVTGAIIG